MNADAGFDAAELRAVCADKEIEVNIGNNKRKETQSSEAYVYFNDLCYTNNDLSLKEPMPSWTALKPCWCATRSNTTPG